MSKPPIFSDSALVAALGMKAPRTFDRGGRVALLGECAEALLAGRLPDNEARMFLAGALSSWLQNGGNLEKDFLKVSARAGSHFTPSHLWHDLKKYSSSRGAQDSENADMLQTSSSKNESKK